MQDDIPFPRAIQDSDAALKTIADIYLTDPAFAHCRADEELWDITTTDGLKIAY
jgi:hypothetical protein